MSQTKYVCIHGHFYQPPRENPWLEEIEHQPSADPYHDWNDRIAAECYTPNASARILDRTGQITAIVNNYSRISFNFGPTLLSWIQEKRPDAYEAILEADRLGCERYSGHGPAMAQAFNHMILPLANSRDKRTQILWGIEDFESRFLRKPEGMWLAETAVDLESLEIMAEHGIKFTLLAPRQCARVRKIGEDAWHDTSEGRVDPRRAYLCRLPSGKTIHLFFYDGTVAQDCAFGGLLRNGEHLAGRLMEAFDGEWNQNQLVHIATDGESYGHHTMYGDMALAYCLHHIEQHNLARVTVYGEFLELTQTEYEAEIFENSSWSCIHGVERWRSNCGCNSGMKQGWQQEWRAPLRLALDSLRDKLATVYEEQMAGILKNPWKVRDDFIRIILDRSEDNVKAFLEKHEEEPLRTEQQIKALKLLEMQRHAMLMYTSCGWFFDEISGIETVQILQYAARAMQLAEEITGKNFEEDFLLILGQAPSNIPELENGIGVYERFAKPAKADLLRVSVHYVISSLFNEYADETDLFCYKVRSEIHDRTSSGRQQLAMGKAVLRSEITFEETAVTYAVLHLGDHNIMAGVRYPIDANAFATMCRDLKSAFQHIDIPQTIRLIDKNFPDHIYSIWHLFKDEQERVLSQVLEPTFMDMEDAFSRIYENHYALMNAIREAEVKTPKVFAATVEFIINSGLKRCMEAERPDLTVLKEMVAEIKRWHPQLDQAELALLARRRAYALIRDLSETPHNMELLSFVERFLELLRDLPLQIDFAQAQNAFFLLNQREKGVLEKKGGKNDKRNKAWLDKFQKIEQCLNFRKAG